VFIVLILLISRILSLELLLNLLQNCGPTFKSGDKFVSAVRSYLCVSLLSNITSQVAQITGLSLQIFVSLIQNFKIHLKSELEVFVSTIFFRILDSENSTFEHKMRVLEVFHDICRDSKDLVELFINYDCDMDAANLFSNIVSAFAKITKVSCVC
jgi:brefeldin A-inhibited guanine nucleotide-exchange protein